MGGANDPDFGTESVHMTVFGGWPVWLLALYQLVRARDHWVQLERCMRQVGFNALLMELQLAGAWFLKDARESRVINWADCHIKPDQANCVLAALGHLHVQVKLVIKNDTLQLVNWLYAWYT